MDAKTALLDALVNDFATRSFRDQGDGDYIVARMASRAALVSAFLWSSQQTIEKYLKCILLLNRIPANSIKHDLGAALSAIRSSGKLGSFDLTTPTEQFIKYLDTFGRFRYLEISNYAFGGDLVRLDRAAWELRRYCTLSSGPRQLSLRQGAPAPIVRLIGGYLERIVEDVKNPAREPLLWQNAFFGTRRRKQVRLRKWMISTNSPLYLHPEILDEILKYVYFPKDLAEAYRAHKRANS